MARQIGAAPQHLRWRCPGRPFLLGADAVHTPPAEAVAADADAVAQRLTAREHQIEPPLRRVYDDGAGRIVAGVAHGGTRDRARAAAGGAEIRPAAHDIAHVE